MPEPPGVPSLRQVVLDTTDARGLAEFWRQLLDLAYRPGDEPPAPNADDSRGRDWLVLHLRDDGGGKGGVALARIFHRVAGERCFAARLVAAG